MTEIKQDEIQQEFFGDLGAPASKSKPRFPSLQKAQKPILISTSIEQILLAGILLVLTACLVFFLGILRGKSLTTSARPGIASVKPAAATPQGRNSTVRQPSVSVASMDRKIAQAQQATLKAKEALPGALVPGLGKPYTIQLVTYKKEDLAEKEVAGLRKKGHTAFIIPSGDYYQVCAGQYVSKEDAHRNLKNFSDKFRDCFIRRR
ncbi:MAG: hypothetical protein A3C47_01415 [Omnitrophica bacterium RIFCSPHIGHO2_02_FULL_51_18]|nr:MAG: hypothetical protein A3C47_01415 [Omnitrophica bacterium RIFCSPHIGHO2_02_FULL_51_18]